MLIDIFFQLSTARQAGFNGHQPITWTEMRSWCLLNEVELSPFEIQILKLMDLTYLSVSNKNNNKED